MSREQELTESLLEAYQRTGEDLGFVWIPIATSSKFGEVHRRLLRAFSILGPSTAKVQHTQRCVES
jgi:hypothetical protein